MSPDITDRVAQKRETLEDIVCERQVHIKNADGLHMRPAMQFVDIASKFKCEITVSNGENAVDGKSIMQMSMLAATCGTSLTIRAQGQDCSEAVEALRQLVEEQMFDEPPPDEKDSVN